MYNLVSAVHKAASFLVATRRLEAPSLFLTASLLAYYNRLRCVCTGHAWTDGRCSQTCCRRKQCVPQASALSSSQLLTLATAVDTLLSAPAPPVPTVQQAFTFMGNLLLGFLTFCLPQRTQILRNLRLEDTIVRTSTGWAISSEGQPTKNNMPLAPYSLPPTVAAWVDKYVDVFRPVLLGEQPDHRYLFVTYAGLGPRTDVCVLIKGLVQTHLGIEVSPHRFRTIIATCLYSEGLTLRDLDAIARTMCTSTSTLLKHYVKVNPSLEYGRAQVQLDSVLSKRARPAEWGEQDEEERKDNVE